MAALLYGLIPRAIGLTWALLVYAIIVGSFGPLLNLPGWAYDLSPFEHPARVPLESFLFVPPLVLTVVAAVLAALGMVAFHRRQINVV